MSWLASFLVMLVEKLLPSLIGWVKGIFVGWKKASDEDKQKADYDKRVDEAVKAYKEAKDAKTSEEALKNMLDTIRRP